MSRLKPYSIRSKKIQISLLERTYRSGSAPVSIKVRNLAPP
jgi:hypothetical protein